MSGRLEPWTATQSDPSPSYCNCTRLQFHKKIKGIRRIPPHDQFDSGRDPWTGFLLLPGHRTGGAGPAHSACDNIRLVIDIGEELERLGLWKSRQSRWTSSRTAWATRRRWRHSNDKRTNTKNSRHCVFYIKSELWSLPGVCNKETMYQRRSRGELCASAHAHALFSIFNSSDPFL